MGNGYYPIMLQLQGKRCVIAGGGAIAERKVTGLLEAGANSIVIIAPQTTPYIQLLAAKRIIHLESREYKEEDARMAALIFAATNDRAVNKQIAADAQRYGALVQVADAGESGDFITPSVVRRGGLLLTASASGSSPAMSKLIRQELEELYSEELGVWIERLGALRKLAYEQLDNEEAKLIHLVLRLAAEEALSAARQTQADSVRTMEDYIFDIGEWLSSLLHRIDRGQI